MHMMARAVLIAALMTIAATGGSAQPIGEPPLAKAANDPTLKWGPCPAIFPGKCEFAVLHGDPARPNADAFLRVPAGYVFPPHRHTSAQRVILVTGQFRIKFQGGKTATLTPGSYGYVPAKLPHDGFCISKKPCTIFIAFEQPVDAEAVAGALK